MPGRIGGRAARATVTRGRGRFVNIFDRWRLP
jgi:hypothetical protein